MDNKDGYRVLGVEKTADEEEIKRAYRNVGRNDYPGRPSSHHQIQTTINQQRLLIIPILLFGGFHNTTKKD
ncbi:MAG TPA: DnaJ domain-containing protein [Chloroflexota bacterium]|nr:DnaJ domain-containing protein [Chloroflexota bacterium]HUM69656.1 DnaJ domain-containing protein [Chloroflexota bacterium]